MPFPTLGIMGGGQLGRMTALAAIPMGIKVRFLVDEPSAPVAGLGEVVVGDWRSPGVLRTFARGLDAVTVESEWAPADHLAESLRDIPVWPSPDTLRTIRHKGRQKQALLDAGLPLPRFVLCHSPEDAVTAARGFGYPVILKKPEGSYDGFGNATARSDEDARRIWQEMAADDELLVEEWIAFRRELTALIVRHPEGACVHYPVVLTEQRDYRCHAVTAPAGVPAAVATRAHEVGLAAVEAVAGVGVMAVELFETQEGDILVNELAPRPHNTGHYTIEACHTSQFENHVRAVLGLPLGDPSMRVPAACMINVIGQRSGDVATTGWLDALAESDVAVHIYGKEAVRPGRKMGHVTATGSDPEEVRRRAERAAAAIQL